jgi:hypothetical protein
MEDLCEVAWGSLPKAPDQAQHQALRARHPHRRAHASGRGFEPMRDGPKELHEAEDVPERARLRDGYSGGLPARGHQAPTINADILAEGKRDTPEVD